MRIGIIAPEFPPDIGGMQTYAYELATEIARRGHDVVVFTIAHTQGELQLDSIKIVPTLKLRRRYDKSILKEYKMDIWHCMSSNYAWVALYGAPTVLSIHGNDFLSLWGRSEKLDLVKRFRLPFGARFDDFIGRILTRIIFVKALHKVRHIISNSEFTRNQFLKRHPFCNSKTSTVNMGVSKYFISKSLNMATKNNTNRLITVSRLSDGRKNIDIVIKSLAALMNQFDFHYVIVGEGEFKIELQKLAESLGFGERIRFTGFVEKKQLRDLLLNSDLFILTSSSEKSDYEGFGLVYIEANACGTPVLAARMGGAQEAIKEGVSGVFVDEVSIGAIKKVLQSFFLGEIKFNRNDCVEYASQYSWERAAIQVIAIYQKILEKRIN